MKRFWQGYELRAKINKVQDVAVFSPMAQRLPHISHTASVLAVQQHFLKGIHSFSPDHVKIPRTIKLVFSASVINSNTEMRVWSEELSWDKEEGSLPSIRQQQSCFPVPPWHSLDPPTGQTAAYSSSQRVDQIVCHHQPPLHLAPFHLCTEQMSK